jgi:hypothetical protein
MERVFFETEKHFIKEADTVSANVNGSKHCYITITRFV